MWVSLDALIQWNDAHVHKEENELSYTNLPNHHHQQQHHGIDWMGFEALLNIEFIDEENLLHFRCDKFHHFIPSGLHF